MTKETIEHFEPFPGELVQKLEARVKSPVVNNPHHPHVKQRMAAQNITLAPPGTPAPNAHQGFRPPMPAAAPMHPQAYTSEPLAVTPNSIEEAVSFALPSNFLFYDFKDLYIQPFKGRHFSKLHRAREEESILHVVEAVSTVIQTPSAPGMPGLAFYLTLPDFFACLYWLRMHSFMKHGFIHKTMCRSAEHQAKVNSGELAADTLRHAETVGKASLNTRQLTQIPDPEKFQLERQDLYLAPASMRDILDITGNDNIDRFAARVAASFRVVGQDVSLFDRMKIVDELSADDVYTIQDYENVANDYGVEETIRWKCKTCGQDHSDVITLEAHSFFPSAA